MKKGETFYRICKTYGVDQEEVARLNHISNPSRLYTGQKIFIPGATEVKKVPKTGLAQGGPARSYRARPDPSPPPPSAVKGTFIFPVPGGEISSRFGPRNGTMHEGIDIIAAEGAAVLAAADGKVVYAGDEIRGYGNMIIVKHSGNLATIYAHNRKNLVKAGEFVKRGQKIAEVGQTGRATGPHLHFEVRVGEKPVNPEFYLP